MPLEKLPLTADQRTVEVRPNGPLSGSTFIMAYPTTALYLRIRSDDAPTNDELMAAVLAAVVDDSIEGGVTSLAPDLVLGLFSPWLETWMEAVFPPASGRRSPRRSVRSP